MKTVQLQAALEKLTDKQRRDVAFRVLSLQMKSSGAECRNNNKVLHELANLVHAEEAVRLIVTM